MDADPEGLLLLTDETELRKRIVAPEVYWVQVEHHPEDAVLKRIQKGVAVPGYRAVPCRAWIMEVEPDIPEPKTPKLPKSKTSKCWIGLTIGHAEGRQLHRLTEAVGHPALRIVRVQVGDFPLGELPVGESREVNAKERALILGDKLPAQSPWRYKKPHRQDAR